MRPSPKADRSGLRSSFVTLLLPIVVISFLLTGLFPGCSNKDNKKKTVYAASGSSCNCEANWFPHSSTPPPMEGKGSPFDTSSTTNCIFHQWSFQKFLFLTRPAAGGHAFFQDNMIQVDARMRRVICENIPGKKATDPLAINVPVLEDTAQAGSGGILHTNPKYSPNKKSSVVYYSIYVNDTLMRYADSIRYALLRDTAHLNNYYTFPVGSLEMKVSWVDAGAIPEKDLLSYYQTYAYIKTGNKCTLTKVALLGMHIVGRVINHPEFIWATFEHHDMAPYYNWQAATPTQDAPITSTNEKLLYKQDTTYGLNGITWDSVKQGKFYQAYSLYKYGVPLVDSNNFMPGTSQKEPLNYNNIDGLNACVASSLDKTDVWRNYFYNGSIWINTDGLTEQQQAQLIYKLGYNIGDATDGSSARGSLNVFNITMETFVQTNKQSGPIHAITVNDLTNCLSCHSATASVSINGSKPLPFTSPLYMSHIFKNSLDTSATLSSAKRLGIIQYMRMLQLKKRK